MLSFIPPTFDFNRLQDFYNLLVRLTWIYFSLLDIWQRLFVVLSRLGNCTGWVSLTPFGCGKWPPGRPLHDSDSHRFLLILTSFGKLALSFLLKRQVTMQRRVAGHEITWHKSIRLWLPIRKFSSLFFKGFWLSGRSLQQLLLSTCIREKGDKNKLFVLITILCETTQHA